MKPTLPKIIGQLALFLFSAITATHSHAATPAADWMSGEWGIGLRFRADQKSEINAWDADVLANQISDIPGIRYVLINISDAAHGDAYVAPHSVLSVINPGSTPTSLDGNPLNGRDLFMEMALAFQAKGINVIAYCATQGPAMLKHGAQAAYDSVEVSDGVYTSEAMDNWAEYVTQEYGEATDDTYKQAYAEVIIDEYAARYGSLINGWWFDHSGFANIPLLNEIVKSHNPNTVTAFNNGQKIPLINNNPGYENYTFGHPTPIAKSASSDDVNLPMLTSIEDTENGYFENEGDLSLGHMFIPIQEKWNSGALVWTKEQGADWMNRCLKAGGAWTWNVDVVDNQSIVREDVVALLNEILAEFKTSNSTPHSWLDQYGLVTDNDYEAADLLDSDGDGQLNYLEYISGTNPNDASSRFIVTAIHQSNGSFQIEWSSQSDHIYTILKSTNLKDDEWSILASDIQGLDSSTSYTTPVADTKAFFRVMTEPAN